MLRLKSVKELGEKERKAEVEGKWMGRRKGEMKR